MMSRAPTTLGYVLLTAAKNEEAYIGETIRSVVRQTASPRAWFIVDDGSSDRTAAIVEQYARQYPFIRLCSAGSRGGRNFGSQYKALQAAFEMARTLDFDCVGVQDADIAPQRADYYACVLREFAQDNRLGLCGGYIYERAKGVWRSRPANAEDSVAGGVQMFRRQCFEQIGGYKPLHYGGSDHLAQLQVQMQGWQVKTLPDHPVYHYRPTSSAGGYWRGLFRCGLEDASFGYHPLFEFVKCGRRLWKRPYVVEGVFRFSGYLWWHLSGRSPLIQQDQVQFLRHKQVAKLRQTFRLRSVAPGTH